MKKIIVYVLLLQVTCLLYLSTAFAAHPDFDVPSRLRPRVDFWIDVFTRYGKYHIVFHHRDYPQAVYDVLDFYPAASKFDSEVRLEKYIKDKKKKHVKLIKKIILDLDKGKKPKTELERKVKDALTLVPGDSSKYRKAAADGEIRTQTGIREKYRDAIIRSGRYMPIIENIFVKEYKLPIELTRMPFIESSFDYTAYSSVGAAGIWQFMKSTARNYMRVDWLVDERRDVISATHGAAKYLRSAYKTLGNWPLAVTSYNHGVAGVRRKVQKLGTKDISTIVEHPTNRVLGFASNNFYPELLAAIEVYNNPYKYFPGIQLENPLKIVIYEIQHGASVSHIQKRLGIDKDTLKQYNYGLTQVIWSNRYRIPKGYVLKLPASYKNQLIKLKSPEPSSASTSVVYGVGTYKVRSGDTLSKIASRNGLTVSKLKQINDLRSNTIYIGQVLQVKTESESKQSSSVVSPSPKEFSSTYKVRRGDTLSSIASRHKVTVQSLLKANGLRSSKIYVNQKLKVPASTSGTPYVYIVRSGDSLWSIAKKFDTSVTHIKRLNNISGNTLHAGQKLRVK